MDEILNQADTIATTESPDQAARFLAPYRKSLCEELNRDTSKIGDLIAVTSAQMQYLIDAGAPDKSIGIAEWFLHIFHHIQEALGDNDFRQLKRVFRESLSRFFRRYAKALRDVERYEDMHIAMRTSLDLTTMLPFAVVAMLHIYAPLHKKETIAGETAQEFLLKRYAEALASLDFSGEHQHPIRAALDEYQYAFRKTENIASARTAIHEIYTQNHDDASVKTIYNLFGVMFPE